MSTPTDSATPATLITVTDQAAEKISALLTAQGRDDLHLRLAVQPGGCAGLRYELFFDDRDLDGDTLIDCGPFTVAVDKHSAPYLTGTTIGYADTISQQGFSIDNPNAGGSCACGDSFN
jgi:iron-sulfur cluster assembly accessory protein